jgi:hypothetical protein
LLNSDTGSAVEVELANGRKATVTFKPGVGGHVKIEASGRPTVDAELAEKVQPNIKIEK